VLDKATFERIAEPLFKRPRQPVARALADSRIRSMDLSHIVLAGGATRMPAVRRLAAMLFGRVPRQTIDPDQVVALGAAVQAGLKMRDAALTDVVLTDVAPYTLGIEVVEFMGAVGVSAGRLLPVIERNTVVPVSRKSACLEPRPGLCLCAGRALSHDARCPAQCPAHAKASPPSNRYRNAEGRLGNRGR
jgi:molecular chaperone HscC